MSYGFYKQHGKANSPTYRIWIKMRHRCLSPGSPEYADYGGRGITICERWKEDFAAFLSDMGEKPQGLSLDRRDNNGNYDLENCRWATNVEQARNSRRTRVIEFGGRTMCLKAWADELGLTAPALDHRLKVWPIEQALTHSHSQGKRPLRREPLTVKTLPSSWPFPSMK